MRIALAILAALILAGCASQKEKRQASVEKYLAQRQDISETFRKSIIDGKVLLGMFPDEANVAAGAFVYNVKPDPKWGEHYFPPQVIFSQRKSPDSSKITMTFCNNTQFDSAEPISFTVHFESGKAVRIERREKQE